MPAKGYLPKRNTTKRTINAVQLYQRRQDLLALRSAGASYSEIVKADIGYNNVQMVSQDMKKVLAEFQYETPEDVLVLDLARLDEIQKLLTVALRSGDLGQAGMIMKVMQFRRETLGITQEQIAERQVNKTNVQNNGIMVIQGQSTGDYVAAMAAAAGISTPEITKELEKIAESNQGKIPVNHTTTPPTGAPHLNSDNANDLSIADAVFTEVIPRKVRVVLKKNSITSTPIRTDDFDTRLIRSAARQEQLDEQNDFQAAVSDSEPLLDIDVVDIEDDTERVFSVPVKDYDHNVRLTTGIPYKESPKKISKAASQKVIVKKLNKKKNESISHDELITFTRTEEI